ncbi:hypothetical protein TNCV_3540651 [Trichonephila clavipes]|nr:hypothetical protein TNCV_3540651 [Trichonephila clavipes]
MVSEDKRGADKECYVNNNSELWVLHRQSVCDGPIAISTKTPFGFLWGHNGNSFRPIREEKRDIQIRDFTNRSLAYAVWLREENRTVIGKVIFQPNDRFPEWKLTSQHSCSFAWKRIQDRAIHTLQSQGVSIFQLLLSSQQRRVTGIVPSPVSDIKVHRMRGNKDQ